MVEREVSGFLLGWWDPSIQLCQHTMRNPKQGAAPDPGAQHVQKRCPAASLEQRRDLTGFFNFIPACSSPSHAAPR